VWQELREELHPKGFEVVTVALDVGGVDATKEFVDRANAQHPSLLDEAHVVDELFGVVNVPNGVWIDEDQVIVRPAEPAFPGRNPVMESFEKMDLSTLPPDIADIMGEVKKIKTEPAAYKDALVDWVEKGAASKYALSPDEVVARSHARNDAQARAAAHFELGQYLHRSGDHEAAIPHWREAHRLQPDNWTYKRQAWSLVGNERVGGDFGRFVQGPLEGEEDDWPFTSDFRSDTALLGEGEYYPNTM
jgi:tetratricopeptide (TPR) repeat protein